MAAGGGRRWQEEVDPALRPRVCEQMVSKFNQICNADQRIPSEKLHSITSNTEEGIFRAAKSMTDYLRRISMKIVSLEQNLKKAAAHRQQQMQMVHHMQLDNAAQAFQGANSLLTVTPQAVSMTAGPVRPPSQLQNQHMENMQINVKHGPSDMMAMLDQTFNSPSAAPVAPGIQSGQKIMHSVTSQSQKPYPAMQLHSTSFARGYPASVAQLHGQPVVESNAQKNQLLKQNSSGICDLQQQPTHFMSNQQALGINQQHMNSQRYPMVGASVAMFNIDNPGGLNNQQNVGWTVGLQSPLKACEQAVLERQTNLESERMTPAQRHVTVSQQSNLHYPGPQTSGTMDSAGAVDWREEMFQQIESWKAAHFLELTELNQTFVFQEITEEQLQSLPKDKAEAYNRRSSLKNTISGVLKFLQLQKLDISENLRGQLPKLQNTIHKLLDFHGKIKARNEGHNPEYHSQGCCGLPETINSPRDTTPFTGHRSEHRNRSEQSVDASISQTRQNTVTTTPPARQKTCASQLQEVISPCVSSKPLGGLRSSPTNDVEVCGTTSPIAKLGVVQVASPYGSLNSTLKSPIAKPGVVAEASPCSSVKFTLTSNVEKSGVLSAASHCSLVKTTLPSTVSGSGVVPVASPCDSVKSRSSKDVNNCHQVTPTKPMVSASPGQAQTAAGQPEDQVYGKAERVVAKKPIDRLLDAVRSSSSAVLRSSVNSIKSALIGMDSVPLPPWGGRNTKMKRAYDLTSYYSESPPPSGTDGSPVTFGCDASGCASSGERDAKRQKTQNVKEALLDEIEDINRILVDTTISITGGTRADGITSCSAGTLIKLSYTTGCVAPSLRSCFLTSGMQSFVMHATLLVPSDYPASSPMMIDDERDEWLRTNLTCISEHVDAKFQLIPEPRSLMGTVSSWDACVRLAVTDFAHRHGGGSLGSRFGRWESCVGT